MTEVLGRNLYVWGWTLQGSLPPEELIKVLQELVRQIGMNPAGLEPAIYQYPLADGRGGVGNTIFLPFGDNGGLRVGWWAKLRWQLAAWLLGRQKFAATVLQPLTESFVVADDYPELDRTYVLVASCRKFDPHVAGELLAQVIGKVLGQGGLKL